jgi:hypothetical protein
LGSLDEDDKDGSDDGGSDGGGSDDEDERHEGGGGRGGGGGAEAAAASGGAAQPVASGGWTQVASLSLARFPCGLYVWNSRYCSPTKSWNPEKTPCTQRQECHYDKSVNLAICSFGEK